MDISDKISPATEEQLLLLSTELEEIKEKFIQSDKLAFIGKLTTGIMHEIKNPLNFINNFTRLSKELIGELNDIIDGISDNLDEDTKADLDDVRSMLEANLTKIAEMPKPIVVYCLSGGRSGIATGLINQSGLQEVYNGGGIHNLLNILNNN